MTEIDNPNFNLLDCIGKVTAVTFIQVLTIMAATSAAILLVAEGWLWFYKRRSCFA